MCAYDEPAGVCESANSGIIIFKDCNTTCTGSDGCNDGNDVELLFSAMDESGNPKDMSCYAYRSDTRDDKQLGYELSEKLIARKRSENIFSRNSLHP